MKLLARRPNLASNFGQNKNDEDQFQSVPIDLRIIVAILFSSPEILTALAWAYLSAGFERRCSILLSV
jgi:hypothetical protein